MNPRSIRSTRERVTGQHAHGFLLGSRLVENDQNTWYNNDTQMKKNSENIILTYEKEKNCFILSLTFAHP